MSTALIYILFIAGFYIVIKGADLLIDGASSIAKKLHVSDLVIGLTIVALGTSAPELMVNIMASLQGNADIAIGNVLGSNIANILLVLGLTSIIYPLSVQKNTILHAIPLSLLSAVIMGILANDIFFNGTGFSALTLGDGLVLLAFFIIFMFYTFSLSKTAKNLIESKTKEFGIIKSILLVLLGCVGLTLGGKWIVEGAIYAARVLGVSESLIGLTIVAVGTTVPELATGLVAAFKKKADIAIGTVVGSNIFNMFFVLGISAVIRPLPFNTVHNTDVYVNIGVHLLLLVSMFIGAKRLLNKWKGSTFILLYASYIVFLVIRG
ncbi:MAG: calcium/sodium antiporter [bacterium]